MAAQQPPRRARYKKRTAAEKQRDTKLILELHYEKYGVREIAEMLGMNYGTVFRDLKMATQEFREANQDFINEKILHMVNSLDHLEEEAWASWFESLEDGVKERVKSEMSLGLGKKKASLSVVEKVKETVGQCGDPRFLTVITRSALAKAKLFESLSLKKSDNELLRKIYESLKQPPETPAEDAP